MARNTETSNEFFEDLKAGLTAAIEHAKGKRKDLRTSTLPRPPKELSAKEIVKVRSQLNVSQAVFARYLNISTKTVQSWGTGPRQAQRSQPKAALDRKKESEDPSRKLNIKSEPPLVSGAWNRFS